VGAIGRRVLSSLQEDLLPSGTFAVLDRAQASLPELGGVALFTSAADLIRWEPDLVVECAGHAVVKAILPPLLEQGIDVILVSVGALSDDGVRARLEHASSLGKARLITVSGAIGALDALQAARMAGLSEVKYVGRKPPQAWRGTAAEDLVDLDHIVVPTLIYQGSASESARRFPQNANVTAAVALAGIGFDDTQVSLIADPTVTTNVHELSVTGAFGHFRIHFENKPLPDNPKTSWLAALSIESELKRYFGCRA
jgi:aspartate dehydrogenase